MILAVILLMCQNTSAQNPLGYEKYIESELIDYSLLLKYRDSIGLTQDQLNKIKQFKDDSPFDIKQKLSVYQEGLLQLKESIESEKPDEETIAIFNKTLQAEKEIKLNRLKFILYSKKILTETQRNQLRLIGRADKLTTTVSPGIYLSNRLKVVKPIYKIKYKNSSAFFITEEEINQINFDKIDKIEVKNNVDVTIDKVIYSNRNLITLTMKEELDYKPGYIALKNSKPNSGDPLYVVIHKGKTTRFNGATNNWLTEIKADDIISIEVYKGENAKKYGKEGENGVVVILLNDKAQYQVK